MKEGHLQLSTEEKEKGALKKENLQVWLSEVQE